MGDNSPISRDEKLLRKLLGQSIQTEPPQSRIEMLLQQIIDGGGVGGSYKIKDAYATLADLQAAHPTGTAGDAYLVGNPAHVYVWAEDASAWEDGGAFSAIAGPAGNGIKSIAKTATVGLVDTYTITFDDDTTEIFDVTNGEDGVGIVSIEKTATVGLVDTYTITLTDGSTYDFTVTNGSGGSGVPEGGTTGQVLAKKSNADGDVGWVNQSGGSDVSSEIASLSASASEAASEIASLSTENSTQSSELSSLSSENSLQTSEIGSLSAASSELASQIASTSTAQSEVDSTQNVALGSLSTENSNQAIELGSLSTSMSELASAASSTSIAQSEVDSTQNAALNSLASENSMQTSEIGSLSTAESELASEVAIIGSEVADKQDELVEGPGIDINSTTHEIKTERVVFEGTLQQWEALTTAEKKAYTDAIITNDEQTGLIDQVPTEDSNNLVTSGGVYHNSSFSTSEIETSIEFNGRKVYRRTFRGYADTYVIYSALRQYNVALINSGVAEVINAYGMIEYDQNGYEYQIPSTAFLATADLATTCHIRHHKTGHSVSLMSESLESQNITRIDYVVTVEYTKTT